MNDHLVIGIFSLIIGAILGSMLFEVLFVGWGVFGLLIGAISGVIFTSILFRGAPPNPPGK